MDRSNAPGWAWEHRAAASGYRSVAGIDEVGRGALAGPVVAAAVVLDGDREPAGLGDSKLLSVPEREQAYGSVVAVARSWAIGLASHDEIDLIGIVWATRRAMMRAIGALGIRADFLIIDAVRLPESGLPHESPIKADRDAVSVAAASIVAKVARDAILTSLDRRFAGYGFARHKGYGTPEHLRAIADLGPCSLHRRSFAPISAPGLWDRRVGGPSPEDSRQEAETPDKGPATQIVRRSVHFKRR